MSVAMPDAVVPDRLEPDEPTPAPASRPRRDWIGSGSVSATFAWLVLTPIAVVLPSAFDLNPLSYRGAVMPIAVAAVVVTVLLGALWRHPSEIVVGVVAGIFASWVAFACAAALHGTPFGFGGLTGDMVRMSAMATRYSTTWQTADQLVQGLPGEYPPLYPWLIGRAADFTGLAPWRLLGTAEVLVTSVAVLVAFVLWRRLVPAPAALAISVLGFAVFHDPRKAYEIVVLAAFVPWALLTFAKLPGKRLHWAWAGIIGGLMVVTYHGFLMLGSVGILALIASSWQASTERLGYLKHLGGVLLVAVATASWYLVPYLVTLFGQGGQQVSDMYESSSMVTEPVSLPFLKPTPLGVIELAGLVGLFWLRDRTWWAKPLLLLLAGIYGYIAIALINFSVSGHTMLVHYTGRLIGVLLVIAAVLSLQELVPDALRWQASTAARKARVTALVALVSWIGLDGVHSWGPAPVAATPTTPPRATVAEATATYANAAHVEPLPDGRLPAYAAPEAQERWLPVVPIRKAVEARLGRGARPVVLSADERLFAFLPWYGYVGTDRTSTAAVVRWDDRYAELQRLAQIQNPTDFAERCRRTRFGGIDVFVLRARGGDWTWGDLAFRPAAFDRAAFDLITDLPNGYVLAIRKN